VWLIAVALDRPKYYVPRNPYQTAPYYPQTPHPLLQTPAIFSQLDVESLFWVFYYLPGTYQQCVSFRFQPTTGL
jgi:CCR4-NOT transcription complex subunit 3